MLRVRPLQERTARKRHCRSRWICQLTILQLLPLHLQLFGWRAHILARRCRRSIVSPIPLFVLDCFDGGSWNLEVSNAITSSLGRIRTHTTRSIALRILGPHVYARREASSDRKRRGGNMLFDSPARGPTELFWLASRGSVRGWWSGVGGNLWYHTSLKKRKRRV